MKAIVNILRRYKWIFKLLVFITILLVPVFVLIESLLLKPAKLFIERIRQATTLILWSAGM